MTGFFVDAPYANHLLDYYWGGASPIPDAPPATWYVALFTTMPIPAGTGGVEAAFTGYARVAVTNDLTQWPLAAAGLKSNANDVDYGVAASGPTTILGFGFYDAPTGGNLWFAVTVAGGSVVVNNGANAKFPAGSIDVSRCV